MGRAGVHRPIYPILSALGVRQTRARRVGGPALRGPDRARLRPLNSEASGMVCAALAGPSQRFFVEPGLLEEAAIVRRCYANHSTQLQSQARSQYLFELDVFDALTEHPLRTLVRTDASVSVLPILALASEHAGSCIGVDGNTTWHHMRLNRLRRAVYMAIRRSKGPLLYTCTCVMQRGYYGTALYRMLERVASRRKLVQLVKEPATKNAVTPHQIVAPCAPHFRAPHRATPN